MKYNCPACGGPNEANSENVVIRCNWCGTEYKPSSAPDRSAAAEAAAASSDAANASVKAADSVLEAAKKAGAGVDPEWTKRIIEESAKAAATAAAAAKAAEAAAAAAKATASQSNATATGPNAASSEPNATSSEPNATVSESNTTRTTAAANASQSAGATNASQSAAGETQTPSGPQYVWKRFADNKTGVILAKAVVPESFTPEGNLYEVWQSDLVPFTAAFQAASPDRSILLSTTSGEMYAWYLNPLLRSFAAQTPNVIKTSFREFIEPDEYLHQYAERMTGIPLIPTARAKLPSAYGNDIEGERQRLLQYVESHMINISVRETVSTCYCDAFLYRYEGVSGGRKIVVFAGCDYKGVESYDANGGPAGIGLLSMGMQGGLLGKMMQGNKGKASAKAGGNRGRYNPQVSPTGVGAGSIPFGHGKEYGKQVDLISWGSERLYFMAAPIEAERAATAAFLRFVGSITPDPALWKQRSLLIEQKHQSRILEAQQLNSQAVQMQIQAQQRQRELARQLQANSEEISRGIMDSWEKRSASQSRISSNWSQAIRGVDTYSTPSGRTVEASVSADHVYQNRYGDTIEVYGNEPDDELVTRLDWTKLNRNT